MRARLHFPFIVALLLGAGSLAVHAASDVVRREQGNLVIEGIPEIPAEVFDRLNQYQNTRSAALQDWFPGGGLLVATRFGETNQIHHVAAPGAARRQLTFFDERVGAARANPDPETPGFLFTRDVGGGEFFQVYFQDLVSGRARLLSDGGRSQNSLPRWSNRGDRFAYTSTRRNGRDRDIFIATLTSPADAAPTLEREGSWGVMDWAPDDGRLLLFHYKSINESTIHVFDLAAGTVQQINPTGEPVSYGDALFAPDGKGVFVASDEGSEFRQLRHIDFASGRITALAPKLRWDVGSLELSDDGRTLAFVANEDGIDRLRLLDTASKNLREVKGLPAGQIGGMRFDPPSRRLALSISSPRTPGDTYVLDVATDGLERWTFSEVGGLDPGQFVEPELIRYPTFDAVDGRPREIPAFYYRPAGAGPLPVLIIIHGGPEAQATPGFSARIPMFNQELGLAVIVPNVRGSSGYGKSYLKLDNGRLREDSVRDIGALLDWIARQPELDASRVAVYGGSYGGYMVLASMVHYSDRLRCGVDVVGVSNFVSFLENTEVYRRDLRRAEYGDERDPEMRAFLERIAPLHRAAEIKRPMFIVQGQNDPRVPMSEAAQIVRAVRDNGQTVWYLLARDEGHGFARKSNNDFLHAALVRFLETFLLE